MDLGLVGKIALVGGSSKGIGFAAAAALAAEGARVVVVARHGEELERAAAKLAAKHGVDGVLAIVGDLSLAADIERIVGEALDHYGRVDIAVNNLGGPPPGELLDFSEDQWQLAFDLSFNSARRLNALVLPGMIERGHGRIVSVLSKTIKEPEDRLGLSTVARTALSAYSKLLAQEVAPHGITVNNVLPGSIATDRLSSVIEAQAKAAGRDVVSQTDVRRAAIPAGRFGQPQEAGELIAFLASDRAAFVTGQNIAIDGGQIKSL
jgi:3-oxoacyl-[acyl-carrier protein] reductase